MMKSPKKVSQTKAYRIRRYMFSHPTAKAKQIAEALGVTEAYVYVVQSKERKTVKRDAEAYKQKWTPVQPLPTPEPLPITMLEPVTDPVNHPAHYKVGGIETIDFIEAKGLNYNMGNAVKYITRADHKGNRKQDLEKAVWYLNRELGRVQGA